MQQHTKQHSRAHVSIPEKQNKTINKWMCMSFLTQQLWKMISTSAMSVFASWPSCTGCKSVDFTVCCSLTGKHATLTLEWKRSHFRLCCKDRRTFNRLDSTVRLLWLLVEVIWTMGRKKIQITRIVDERNRQVGNFFKCWTCSVKCQKKVMTSDVALPEIWLTFIHRRQ